MESLDEVKLSLQVKALNVLCVAAVTSVVLYHVGKILINGVKCDIVRRINKVLYAQDDQKKTH